MPENNTHTRQLHRVIQGLPTTDGAGVQLTRMIATPELDMLDPFLLFDKFESNQAQDYIAGFPNHPHRGFETVTYLLAGRMRHKDNAGHEGVIEAGGVQWMTAGKGIIHSEMPEQENGLLHGFQLWINLPAKDKMQAPAYQEFSADKIAVESLDNGTEIRVIAGSTDRGTMGPAINHNVNPLYLDVSLPKNETFKQTVKSSDNAFIFLITGEVMINNSSRSDVITQHQLGILQDGDLISITANTESRFLLLAATPLNEPVARGGPFVMNTEEEITQAFKDFRNGHF